jgi:hypothetical protein
MEYIILILPVTGLVFSIIGFTRRIKGSWFMLVMWTISTLYLLSTIFISIWWPNYIFSKVMHIIQIIWIVLANRQIQEVK